MEEGADGFSDVTLSVTLPFPDRRSSRLSSFVRMFASNEEVSRALARAQIAEAVLQRGCGGALVVEEEGRWGGVVQVPPYRMSTVQALRIALTPLPRQLGLPWEKYVARNQTLEHELLLDTLARFSRLPFATITVGLVVILIVTIKCPATLLPIAWLSQNIMVLGLAMPAALILYAAIEERHYRCSLATQCFGILFPLVVVLLQGKVTRGVGKLFILVCAYTMLAFHVLSILGDHRPPRGAAGLCPSSVLISEKVVRQSGTMGSVAQ